MIEVTLSDIKTPINLTITSDSGKSIIKVKRIRSGANYICFRAKQELKDVEFSILNTSNSDVVVTRVIYY